MLCKHLKRISYLLLKLGFLLICENNFITCPCLHIHTQSDLILHHLCTNKFEQGSEFLTTTFSLIAATYTCDNHLLILNGCSTETVFSHRTRQPVEEILHCCWITEIILRSEHPDSICIKHFPAHTCQSIWRWKLYILIDQWKVCIVQFSHFCLVLQQTPDILTYLTVETLLAQ